MWKFHQYLYNKQNITWPLGDINFIFSCWKYLSLVRCAHSWGILSALEDKIRISARPWNILYFRQNWCQRQMMLMILKESVTGCPVLWHIYAQPHSLVLETGHKIQVGWGGRIGAEVKFILQRLVLWDLIFISETFVLRPSKFHNKINIQGSDKHCEVIHFK